MQSRRFTLGAQVTWRRIVGEVVILKLETGEYYSLADAGADAWEWLAKGADAPTVAATLSKIFGITPTRAEKDVSALISQLKKENLLADSAAAKTEVKLISKPAASKRYAGLSLNRYSRLDQPSYALATY